VRGLGLGRAGGVGVGFGEGGVGRGGGPADDYEEDVEDEEGDGDVVEDHGLMRVGPELVGGPEEKGKREQYGFEPLPGRRPVDALIDEVGERDHDERKCAEEVVGSGGEEVGGGVPSQQRRDARESEDSEDDRDCPVGPVETGVHRVRLSQKRGGQMSEWR